MVRGLWICAARVRLFFRNSGTWHKNFKQQLAMLRLDSSRIMCIKYVMAARKKHVSRDPFAAIAAVADFKYFPIQPRNLIACNNPVWMGFQPNFYLLCVVYLQRQIKKLPEFEVYECYVGEGKQCAPRCPEQVYHLDIRRMRIVTIQCQDNGIFF